MIRAGLRARRNFHQQAADADRHAIQLGATDAAQRLTPLGWWGLPEALQKAWSPAR